MATDGRTDYEDVKLYSICARYFDEGLGKVMSVLLSLRECNKASTGENIFKILHFQELDESHVPWKNLVIVLLQTMHRSCWEAEVAAFFTTRASSVYISGWWLQKSIQFGI